MNFKGLAQLQQAYGLGMLQHHTRRCCFSLVLAEYTVNTASYTLDHYTVEFPLRNCIILCLCCYLLSELYKRLQLKSAQLELMDWLK